MRFANIILLLLSCLSAKAQNAFLFHTTDDFLNNKYEIRDSLKMLERSHDDKEWSGSPTYRISLPDDKKNVKEINRDYFAVEHHDSLFVNLYGMMNVVGFANVTMRMRNYLYFKTVASNLPEHRRYVALNSKGHVTKRDQAASNQAGAYILGGVIGGLAYTAASEIAVSSSKEGKYVSSKRFNYLFDLETATLYLLTPDVLENMLQARPNLLSLYQKSGYPDDDGTYYFYLCKLFNIE